MEAAPRLPMLSFDLKVCVESVRFGPPLKQYIANFYNEDPETYTTEIQNLETLRATAVRPSMDVNGVQILKKYYCQLHFLKSRFPMEENQEAAVQFFWKYNQTGMSSGIADVRYELMVIMYNIGALHTYLGKSDSRNTAEGMKMACSHFQCAAWAFQNVKEKYQQFVGYVSTIEIVHLFQQICFAQAQECILEKSMLDNRKATIIAKVAVQVYNFYSQSLTILVSINTDLLDSKVYKEWAAYLQFKVAYHKCIALLFQGQQAEEQAKMGERVAFYQAACEQLEEARKISSSLPYYKQEIAESLAFTQDVVEGKRKAAKNENEFIYHEEVPDKDRLQEVKGAALVKGTPFSVNDVEVSGPDIFARLVPMEAHEAASLYSEQKAQMLRQVGELVEAKDQALAEFMTSMQLDLLTKMHQATGIPQELIDRAAAMSAKPNATQELVEVMGKLSNVYQEVESNLKEIDSLLQEEEEAEKAYQEIMGKRPPSIVATDLAREAAKYREAQTKANDSNQTLHRAMTAHVANLKILQQPLRQLQQQLPTVELPNPNIDEQALKDLEMLVTKVDEMRTQRAMLWSQFRDAVHKDDITNSLVTKQPNQSLEQLFQQELQKHQQLGGLLEQNCVAQENIKKALVDSYASAVETRRYIQDIIQKRGTTIAALIASCDSYDDLLAKANKGVEFYNKLETNVSKLLQRVRSACKVQQEEREQMLSKNDMPKTSFQPSSGTSAAPKLKDYLDSRKKTSPAPGSNYHEAGGLPQRYQQQMGYLDTAQAQAWPPGVRPAPLGSEVSDLPVSGVGAAGRESYAGYDGVQYPYKQLPSYQANPADSIPTNYSHQRQMVDQDLINRMNSLLAQNASLKSDIPTSQYSSLPQSSYANSYADSYANYPTYTTASYSYPSQSQPGLDSNLNQNTNYYGMNSNSNTLGSTMTTNSYNYQPTASTYASNAFNQYPTSSVYPGTNPDSINNYPGQSPGVYDVNQNSTQYPSSSLNNSASVSALNNPLYADNYPGQSHAYGNQNSNQYPSSSNNSSSVSALNNPVNAVSMDNYSGQSQGAYNNQNSNQYPTSSFNNSASVPVGNNAVANENYSAASTSVYSHSQSDSAGYYPYSSGYSPIYTNPNNPGLNSSNSQTSVSQYAAPTQIPNNTQTYGAFSSPTDFQAAYTGLSNAAQGYSYPTSDSQQNYLSTSTTQTMADSNAASSYSYPADYSAYSNTNTQFSQPQTNQPYYSTTPGASYQTYATPETTAAYGGSESYYGQTYNYNYPVPTNSVTQTHVSAQVSNPTIAKESTIDLLSGLDFTISQAPLIPQQKVPEKVTKPEIEVKEDKCDAKISPAAATVVNQKEKIETKEIKRPDVKVLPSRSLNNDEVKNLFHQEIDKYEKHVESLTSKTLSGPTNLDIKWKEIQDKQNSDGQKRIISVARCYPMKNRFPDILPYDHSRIELSDAKDDYINASFVKNISPFAPPIIVTQTPLSSTVGDFWTMIREQQVELIFCLANDSEIGEDVYWPKEKSRSISVLNMVLTLQSVTNKTHWVERLISVSLPEKRESWVVMHLQFTSWPGSLFPTTPEPFTSFVLELVNLHQQQKLLTHSVVVHCASGIGRSGIVCLLTAAILDVTNNSSAIPDLVSLALKLADYRKNILRDREHLKFAYECFLAYMRQVVAQDKIKRKLTEVVPSLEEIKMPVDSVETNLDPLGSLDPFWASKK